MKFSNFALAIVASLALGAAVSASIHTIPSEPTAVISVPKSSSVRGGGFTVSLPKNLTRRQVELLTLAYAIAKKDGHTYPQLLQGILLQESRAGEHASYKVAGQEFGLKANLRYYGVTQIKLAAARDVLDRYPELKRQYEFNTLADEEVIAKLIENDSFNLAVASKYLLIMRSYGYDTITEMALAYNQGPGGAKNFDASTHHYPNGVMKYIQMLSTSKKNV